MEERPRPRDDLDRPEMALVRPLAAAREHRDRDARGRDRLGQRTVDRSEALVRRAAVIHAHRRSVDGDLDVEVDLLVDDAVAVERSAPAVDTVGDVVEPAAHRRLAVIENALDGLAERIEPVAFDDAEESGGAGANADELGVDVAGDRLRYARVGERHPVDVSHDASAAHQLDAGEDRPLLEHVDGVGGVRLLAADVEPVRLDRGVSDQLVAVEDGHHDRRVLRVRSRRPRSPRRS